MERLLRGLTTALAALMVLAAGVALFLVLWSPPHVVWGSYTTSLAERTPEERGNIELAVRALDGAIIPAHGELSFNEIVGPRRPEDGYREATTYIGDRTASQIGGGICQVSSTLYNAALYAGLDVAERHAHSRPVASVPPGRDATVAYGTADLRLRNPWEDKLVLRAKVGPARLIVEIVGSREPPFRAQLNHDLNRVACSPGGRPGFRSRLERVLTFADGTSRRELIAADFYPPRDGTPD